MTRAAVQMPAGQIEPCGGGHAHGIRSVHVVVLCECGSAYRSTDATIALAMASRHEGHVAPAREPEEIKP